MKFFQKVYHFVSAVPAGRISTYGHIATLCGQPRAARQVGFALKALSLNENKVPWWRIVNKQGYISINHGSMGEKDLQRQLLEEEGIEVDETLHIVDMQKYFFGG